jgi:hypothetical protein
VIDEIDEIDKIDVERHLALTQLCQVDRHGTVEGVEIDLRHELLAPQEWWAWPLGDIHSKYRSRYAPFIWFPWFGKFDADSIRENLKAALQDGDERPTKKKVDDLVRYETPECFVNAGDKIVIDRVECETFGKWYDHLHDAQVRYAFLRIVRARGKSQEVKTPLRYVGVTSLLVRAGNDLFSKLVSRICNHFGMQALEEFESLPEENSHAYGALWRAHQIERQTREIRLLADDPIAKSPEHHAAFATWRMIGEVIMMGYLWAKAEAELGLQPLAESSLLSRIGASVGGKQSGQSRRDKRANTWNLMLGSSQTRFVKNTRPILKIGWRARLAHFGGTSTASLLDTKH